MIFLKDWSVVPTDIQMQLQVAQLLYPPPPQKKKKFKFIIFLKNIYF